MNAGNHEIMKGEIIFWINWLKRLTNRSRFCIISDLLSLEQRTTGTEDDTSKVVESTVSIVETESSVMAVFPGLRTEDNTSKVIETAASVVAVLMLTSGVSVADSDESTFRSTFVEGSAM